MHLLRACPDLSLVMGQSPAAGTKVAMGSKVDVFVAGPTQATVPDVVGRSAVSAKTLLEQAGLVPGKKSQRVEPGSPDGTVVDQEPSSGKSVERGAKVDLVFAARQAHMPDVTGLPIKEAAARLEKAGLKLTTVKWRATDASPPCTVVEQQPAAGGPTAEGTEVTLVYALAK